MKATELRLNNLINIGGSTLDTYQTYVPTLVTIAILASIQEENKERPDAILSVFQPIPLTEEWLVKFGFYGKYKSVNTQWSLGGFSIQQESNVDEEHNTIPTEQRFHYNWDFVVEYVHSLQNLYFALTGEELAIK